MLFVKKMENGRNCQEVKNYSYRFTKTSMNTLKNQTIITGVTILYFVALGLKSNMEKRPLSKSTKPILYGLLISPLEIVKISLLRNSSLFTCFFDGKFSE